jgi:hypothetical protein
MNMVRHRVMPNWLSTPCFHFLIKQLKKRFTERAVEMRIARVRRPNEVIVKLVIDVAHSLRRWAKANPEKPPEGG